MQTKTCYVCKETKPLEDFNKDNSRKDKRQGHCRDCARELASLPAHRVGRHLYDTTVRRSNKYGLTAHALATLLASGCAVCGTMENLHIDHDHRCCSGRKSCGKCVRGCLCNNHNLADGFFKSVEEIEAYLAYRMEAENANA